LGLGQPASGSKCSRRTEWVVLTFVLVVIGALSMSPVLVPPIGVGQQGSVDAVRRHIEVIASEPHPMGTEANERVRSYIIGELAEAGILAETQAVEAPDYFGISGGSSVEVVNVLAKIPGASPSGTVLLVAHYDTVPSTPGANDNSMAVGNLLELARAVRSGPQLTNDVVLLFSDGEEPAPRYGADAFMDHPWAADVAVVFNLEGVAESGPSMLVEKQGGSWITGSYAQAVDQPAAFSFMTQTAELIGGASSDFDVFREAGILGLNFATFRGSAIYHTPEDAVERVNDGVIAHQGSTALGLVTFFGGADLVQAASGGEDVFFTVARNTMVHHPMGWLTPVWIASLLALIALTALRARAGRLTVRSVLTDIGFTLGAMLAAMVVGSGMWMVIVAIFPHLGVAASYLGLFGIAVVVGGISVAVIWWRAGADRADSVLIATLVVWLTLAAVLLVGAPAASYAFVWPALVGVAAALSIPLWRRRWAWVVGTSLVALVALVLVSPMIDTFFLLAGPRPGNRGSELPYVVAASALCGFLAIMLIGTTARAGAARSIHAGCSCRPGILEQTSSTSPGVPADS